MNNLHFTHSFMSTEDMFLSGKQCNTVSSVDVDIYCLNLFILSYQHTKLQDFLKQSQNSDC
jgi:hypothetical protein